jgi:hypothetical protein
VARLLAGILDGVRRGSDEGEAAPFHPQWMGTRNGYGTVQSRIDILRAVAPGEGYITVADVHPGGDSLLQISG